MTALIQFCLSLLGRYFLSHYYREEFIVDKEHPNYRRLSVQYRRKQSIVKNFWIGSGVICLVFPFLPLIAIMTLATTFISFCILDETD